MDSPLKSKNYSQQTYNSQQFVSENQLSIKLNSSKLQGKGVPLDVFNEEDLDEEQLEESKNNSGQEFDQTQITNRILLDCQDHSQSTNSQIKSMNIKGSTPHFQDASFRNHQYFKELAENQQQQNEPKKSNFQQSQNSNKASLKIQNQDSFSSQLESNNNMLNGASSPPKNTSLRGFSSLLEENQKISKNYKIKNSQLYKSQLIDKQQQKIIDSEIKQDSKVKFDLFKYKLNFWQKSQLEKMIKTFSDKLQSFKISNINVFQLKLINDTAYFDNRLNNQGVNQRKQTQFIKNTQNSSIFNIFRKIPVFKALSIEKLAWDILVIGIIMIYFVIIPIIIAFNMTYVEFLGYETIHYTLLAILNADIFVNCNTAVFDKGIIEYDRKKIINYYFNKGGFWEDIFGLMSIFFSTQENEIFNYFQLIFYFKFSNFKRIYRRLEQRFNLKPMFQHTFSLLNLLFIVLFICHLFACLWILVPRYQNRQDKWIVERGIQDEQWYIQFLHSYYFISVIMITVGFGEISPTSSNSGEIFLCIFTMLIACGVFAYAMNEIGLVLEKLQSQKEEENKNMYAINSWMNQKKVDTDLQHQVREYLRYYWKEISQENQDRKDDVLEQLSEKLKQALLKDANKIIVEQCPIFKNNFSEELIQACIPYIKEIFLMPEETICEEQNDIENNIFFIEKGRVEVKQKSINSELGQKFTELKEGQYFGELMFFTGQNHLTCRVIKSIDFTRILKIQRSDFLKLIFDTNQDKENFNYIKDRLLYSNQFDSISLQCQSCQQKDHLISQCPRLFFIPNKKQVSIQQSLSQPRLSYLSRSEKPKTHCIKYCYVIQEALWQFYQDNYELLDNDENMDEEEYEQYVKQQELQENLNSLCTPNESIDNGYYKIEDSVINLQKSLLSPMGRTIKEEKERHEHSNDFSSKSISKSRQESTERDTKSKKQNSSLGQQEQNPIYDIKILKDPSSDKKSTFSSRSSDYDSDQDDFDKELKMQPPKNNLTQSILKNYGNTQKIKQNYGKRDSLDSSIYNSQMNQRKKSIVENNTFINQRRRSSIMNDIQPFNQNRFMQKVNNLKKSQLLNKPPGMYKKPVKQQNMNTLGLCKSKNLTVSMASHLKASNRLNNTHGLDISRRSNVPKFKQSKSIFQNQASSNLSIDNIIQKQIQQYLEQKLNPAVANTIVPQESANTVIENNKQFDLIHQFENSYSYEIYYPQFNMDQVLDKQNLYLQKKQEKQFGQKKVNRLIRKDKQFLRKTSIINRNTIVRNSLSPKKPGLNSLLGSNLNTNSSNNKNIPTAASNGNNTNNHQPRLSILGLQRKFSIVNQQF